MIKPHIILLNGTLWVIELPEKPERENYVKYESDFKGALYAYEQARSAAIENKVEIENPDLVYTSPLVQFHRKFNEGEEILWPGTVDKIEKCDTCHFLYAKCVNRNNPDDCTMRWKVARLIAPEQKQKSMQTKEEAISQIRAGKLAIENDGTVDQLNRVLRLCWPADLLNSKGRSKFYIERQNGWQGDESTHLDVIKVTELIQLMEEKHQCGFSERCKEIGFNPQMPCEFCPKLKLQPVPQLRHTDNQREAWEAWEEDQKTNPNAVNPQAFVYGYSFAKNKYAVPQLLPSEKKCADCGTGLNEGEAKTFTVCGQCWDKHYAAIRESALSSQPLPLAQSDQEEIVDSLLFLLRSVPEDSLKHTILQKFTITRKPQ